MRIGLVNHAAVEVRQLWAFVEHIGTRSRVRSIPAIAHIDSGKRGAVAEHVVHIRHLGCVEVAEIQAGERGAVTEHVTHIRHLGRIEVAEIQAGESGAVAEHVDHIRHLGRIEVAEIQAGERGADVEHVAHIRHIGGIEFVQPTDCRERGVVHIAEPISSANRSDASVHEVHGRDGRRIARPRLSGKCVRIRLNPRVHRSRSLAVKCGTSGRKPNTLVEVQRVVCSAVNSKRPLEG